MLIYSKNRENRNRENRNTVRIGQILTFGLIPSLTYCTKNRENRIVRIGKLRESDTILSESRSIYLFIRTPLPILTHIAKIGSITDSHDTKYVNSGRVSYSMLYAKLKLY